MVHTHRGSRIGRSSYDFIDYTPKTENVLARCSVDEMLDREVRSIVAQRLEWGGSCRLQVEVCLRLRARGSLTRQTANAYLALSLSCAIVPASGLRTVQVFASLTRLSSSPSPPTMTSSHPMAIRSHVDLLILTPTIRTYINTASTIHPLLFPARSPSRVFSSLPTCLHSLDALDARSHSVSLRLGSGLLSIFTCSVYVFAASVYLRTGTEIGCMSFSTDP